MIKISEITLLSTKEYWKYQHLFGDTKRSGLWWLRSQGADEASVAYIYNSSIFRSGYRFDSTVLAVRPALWLNVERDPFDYFAGDEMDLLGLKWTVLDVKHNDLFIVCNDVVAHRRFDTKTNVWETSELRAWLEEWLEYMAMGLDDVVYGEAPFNKKPGDICRVGKYGMIVLEDRDGECLLLAKDFYRKNVVFGDTNNFDGSNADKICVEFAKEIEAIVGAENIIEHAVDLTSRDGYKDYDKIYSCASLLTEDMYKRYKDTIDPHKVDDCWWLATPLSIPKGTGEYGVSCVSPGGNIGSNNCGYGINGVRPFCILKSSILVS